MRIKKALSIVLAIVMVLGTMPLVFAAGDVAKIGTAVYTTLADAVAAAKNNDVVQLLADTAVSDPVVFDVQGGAVTLDLGGKTLSAADGFTYPKRAVVMIENGTKLTITNGTIDSGSTVYAAVALTVPSGKTFAANGYAELVTDATLRGRFYGIVGNGTRPGTKITVNAGAVIEGTESGNNHAIYNPQGDSFVTINGGTLTGYCTAIEMRSGNLVINGGTLEAKAETFECESNGSGSTVSGAAVAISQHKTNNPISVTVNGGTLKGLKALFEEDLEDAVPNGIEISVPANSKAVFDGAVEAADVTDFVAGGTFTQGIDADYLTDDCTLRVNSDGSTTVLETVVATIDDVPYGTLEEAVAAASAGDEIVLQSDIALTDVLFIDKEVTIDLNGKKITPAGSTIYSELPKDRDTLIIVKYGGNLTINDSVGSGEINAGNNETIYAAVKLTSVGETYTNGCAPAVLTVNGGKIAGYYYGIVGNGNRHNTSVTVNGGIITSNCEDDGQGIYNPQSGTVTITGGELVGYCSAIEMRAGTLNITGGTFTATAPTYSTAPSGSGTTTTGAAIAIAQHTTGKELTVNISNATISGTKSVSVADPNNVKLNNVEVTLGDATYNGELAYSAETAEVTNDGAEITVPVEYDWYNDELLTTTDAHLSADKVDEGGLMGHQDKIGASGVGRTIIGLSSSQLNAICASGEDLVIIGGDMGKQTTVSADCAYTYFYNGDTQITAEDAGCAAFIIIDSDVDGNDISGYGYYRIYSGTTDNFLFDVMYANPNA